MNNSYHFSPFPLFQVDKIVKKFKPDIINVCSPYPIGLSAIICGKKYGIPTVGSIHILPENMLAPFIHFRFYKTMWKYAWSYLVYFYNRFDWTTVPTETGANMYKTKGLKANVTPISNGVDTELFKPDNDGGYLRKKYGLPKENIVLYTGRINQEKNLDVLIKAIPYMLEETDAHFLFCGSGGTYKQEMIDLTKKLKISDKTTFIDFLDWKDYPNIYPIANLFVMPAEAELQSIVTMEAIASGLPVIVVNKGAVPELVKSGNGFLFEPKNSKQLATQIAKILNDKKLQKTMKAKSLQVAQRHSMSSVCSQFLKVYENLINNYKTK